MNPIRYVILVVVDPATGFTVGLTKKKGPGHLLNRITFPGGKIDGNETIEAAASREMREETGVKVAEESWTLYESIITQEYELHKLVALSDKVLYARSCEIEPVWHLAYVRHLEYAQRQPAQYANDFIPTLLAALGAVGVFPETAPTSPAPPNCV